MSHVHSVKPASDRRIDVPAAYLRERRYRAAIEPKPSRRAQSLNSAEITVDSVLRVGGSDGQVERSQSNGFIFDREFDNSQYDVVSDSGIDIVEQRSRRGRRASRQIDVRSLARVSPGHCENWPLIKPGNTTKAHLFWENCQSFCLFRFIGASRCTSQLIQECVLKRR
jgi:hypothetical protein